ncbi:MAG: ABC transporter permease subunit [Dehalococcoidales bacterium]|nr:ABC transporter permease subunit [Dehalococcoidales bacterium]
MIRLVLADLFQFLRRWMPYVLLLSLCLSVLISIEFDCYQVKQLIDYGITYDDYIAALETGDSEALRVVLSSITYEDGSSSTWAVYMTAFDKVVLPHYIKTMFANFSGFSISIDYIVLFFIILAASFIGAEYQWGTVRQALAKGIGRTPYFGSKYITLVILAWLFVCGATLFVLIAGMVTTWLVTGGVSWDFISTDTAKYLLSSMALVTLILLAYAMLTALFSTLFKSAFTGMIAGVMYLQMEDYLVWLAISDSAFSMYNPLLDQWVTTAPPEWPAYTIGYNAQYLMAYISPGLGESSTYLNQTLTNATQSVLVLAAYCVVFILVSYFIFRKQNLTSDQN